MYHRTTPVTCPWCRNEFSVQIGISYRNAEAISQQSDDIETYIGENLYCPNTRCQLPLFVHFMK
jgi:hypothetical protein